MMTKIDEKERTVVIEEFLLTKQTLTNLEPGTIIMPYMYIDYVDAASILSCYKSPTGSNVATIKASSLRQFYAWMILGVQPMPRHVSPAVVYMFAFDVDSSYEAPRSGPFLFQLKSKDDDLSCVKFIDAF